MCTQQLERELPAPLPGGPQRAGSRAGMLNNYSRGLGGRRLISCSPTASIPSCRPGWPSAQEELPATAGTAPIVASPGKSVVRNVLPIVRAAGREGKGFLLLLQRQKKGRVCWSPCSFRRPKSEGSFRVCFVRLRVTRN